MALSASEQLVFVTEPNDTWEFPGDFTLRQVVLQSAVNWTTNFAKTYKTGAESTQYFININNTTTVILSNQSRYVENIVSILMSELGAGSATYAQVLAATTLQWEDFINDQMNLIVWILSQVTKAEIAEYNALP